MTYAIRQNYPRNSIRYFANEEVIPPVEAIGTRFLDNLVQKASEHLDGQRHASAFEKPGSK